MKTGEKQTNCIDFLRLNKDTKHGKTREIEWKRLRKLKTVEYAQKYRI